MNPQESELRRLYLLADGVADAPCLMTAEGHVRAMVLELSRPADWNALSTVWQRVQSDLELPAPAIAVSGNDGYAPGESSPLTSTYSRCDFKPMWPDFSKRHPV